MSTTFPDIIERGTGIAGRAYNETYGDDFFFQPLDAKWNLRGLRAGSAIPAQGDGSDLWVGLSGAPAFATLDEPFTASDEAEIILSLSDFGFGTMGSGVGPFMVNSSGTGYATVLNLAANKLQLITVTAWANGGEAGSLNLMGTTANGPLKMGLPYWLSLVKKGSLYFARLSLDGRNWSQPTDGISTALTLARCGFGRIFTADAYEDLFVRRIDVVDNLAVGNNLCITPTGGASLTFTESSEFNSSFTASKAADGNASDGWAAASSADNPMFWQIAWSVGQTFNRVRLKGRGGSPMTTHLEFSDGSLARGPVVNSGVWQFIDFPTKTSCTSLRVYIDDPSGSNGFAEVEAYLAS